MPIDIHWTASQRASCFHAAEALLAGRTLVEPKVVEALSPAADALAETLELAPFDPPALWRHLVPLSTSMNSHRELARVAATKAGGRGERFESLSNEIAGCLRDLEQAFQSVQQESAEQLEIRGSPLRSHWEARGAGLLHQLAHLTDPKLLVPRAEVVLVHPVLGGGGAAHTLYNSIRFEAVLTNPLPHLPEVARLAWLLAQLNLDLPVFQGRLTRDRAELMGQLALIPPVLAAAETVELLKFAPPLVADALVAWVNEEIDVSDTAEIVSCWWATYADSRPEWDVALAALDHMLLEG